MSVASLVDRGLEIKAQMKRLKDELEDIEEKLERAGAKGEQEDLKDADREGKQFLARGSTMIVPIIFTADQLLGSFKAKSEQHIKIDAYSRGKLMEFYKPSTKYESLFKSGKQFRIEAKNILGPEAAAPFVTACLARDKFGVPKSDVKIEWEKAEEAA